MAGKTQYHADAVLNTMRGVALASWTPYLGLLSVAPTDDSLSGTELSGGNYGRVVADFDAPVDVDGTKLARRSYLDAAVVSPTASALWTTAVAWGVWDAVSGGNLRYWKLLTTSVTIPAGGRHEFDVNTYVLEG